jgi:hypothetical protein
MNPVLSGIRRRPHLLAGCVLLGLLLPVAPRIESPRLGLPAIRLAGESFSATVRSGFWPLCRPSFELERGGRRWPLEARQHGFPFRTISELCLPSELEPGAYTLVARTAGGFDRRLSAVHVRAPGRAEDRLRLLHLADLPVLVDEQGQADWDSLVQDLAAWKPDAILLGGDIAYGGWGFIWERLERGLARLDMPVIAALGNHEFEGLNGYLDRFGPPWHRVDVGRYSVLTLATLHGRDQFSDAQLDWLEAELERLAGRPVIVQMHHTFFGDDQVMRRRERLRTALERHGVRLVLSGDVHHDQGHLASGLELPGELEGSLPSGVLCLATTSAGRHVREGGPHRSWPGFRLIEYLGDEPTWVGFDADADGLQEPMRSLPASFWIAERPADAPPALPKDAPIGELTEALKARRRQAAPNQ